MRSLSLPELARICSYFILISSFTVFFIFLLLYSQRQAEDLAMLDARYVFEEGPSAILKTTEGYVVIGLYPAGAPMSVYSFITLAKGNYYNTSTFHYVVPQAFVQGGKQVSSTEADLRARVAHKLGETYKERSDITPRRGDVVLVNSGSVKREYQFLIVTGEELPALRGKYPRLGKIVSGMDVIEKIADAERGGALLSLASIEKILIK